MGALMNKIGLIFLVSILFTVFCVLCDWMG